MFKDALQHKAIDPKKYVDIFDRCSQSSILQSIAYGDAKCAVEGFQIERIIIEEYGDPIAIYQILKKRIPFFGTVARINRGPLFIHNGFQSFQNLYALYRSLYCKWVIKEGFYLQIAPNLPQEVTHADVLEEAGFIPNGYPNWKSGWVALNRSEETLRKALKQKWRNLLNKSERMGLEVHSIESKHGMEMVLKEYDRFMKERKFQSTSSDLLRVLYRFSPHTFYTVVARKEGKYIGAVIIIRHGDSATYLVGMTSATGRSMNANYLLLWQGMLLCRKSGLEWFDVGGIDEVGTAGIAHFKKGLNFTPYQLVGEYEGYRGINHSFFSRLKRYYHQIFSNGKNVNAKN